ncbi:MAG: hypothetical protein O3B97_01785 [Actinomycetota bacterium]|nr:hypothetical protein [Thermoleophilia bacterium]MDA3005375.1 hypothetical protein [Actinomycetota bacterium]
MRNPLALALALVVAASALVAGCGGGTSADDAKADPVAAFADRDASGEALAYAWPSLVGRTGSDDGVRTATPQQVKDGIAFVRPYLDPAFQLQRAGGERYVRDDYVPPDFDAVEVSNVVTTQPRPDVKVVRYVLSTPDATVPDAGAVLTDEATPQLAVFRWDEQRGHWVVVSHANFVTPVAAICEQDPIPVAKVRPDTSAADTRLGESLVAQWRDITTGKVRNPGARSPEGQIQLADGRGWPSADGDDTIEWKPAKAYEVRNPAITRNGDVLVASYDAVASDITIEGRKYRTLATPRLLTYLRDSGGAWKQVGLANFTVPTGVPAGVDCVAAAR